ncbi:MAG: hypothetical protein ACI906_002145 [Candidatus Latescibacterota bacterium]|jgi:hypothetical protein
MQDIYTLPVSLTILDEVDAITYNLKRTCKERGIP